MQDEILYKFLKLFESYPHLSQRDIAKQLDISLGKVNKSIKYLTGKGFVTVKKLMRHPPRIPYQYSLTSRGLIELSKAAERYLNEVQENIKHLEDEMATIRQDLRTIQGRNTNNR